MARVKRAVAHINGQLNDVVYFASTKYGYHTRKARQKKSKKNLDALHAQNRRNSFLNGLAGELRNVISAYSGSLLPSGFYHSLLRRFRREALDNRYLLLRTLDGMEINPSYPFSAHGACQCAVTATDSRFIVRLMIDIHPQRGQYNSNCYCYEVLLLCWTTEQRSCTSTCQYSEWINYHDPEPVFEFKFPRKANTMHWLLCLRKRMGVNEKEIESFTSDGMKIAAVGTFDEADEKILTQRKKDEEARIKGAIKKAVKPITRVKPISGSTFLRRDRT